jgi:hypothetical protein
MPGKLGTAFEMPESLDDQTRLLSGSDQVSRRRPPKNEGQLAQSDFPWTPIGEDDDLGRNLFGKAQGICGVGPAELPLRLASPHEGSNGPQDVRSRQPGDGMLLREVVESSSDPADLSRLNQSVQGDRNGGPISDVEQLLCREHAATWRFLESPDDRSLNGLRVLHGVYCSKYCIVFATIYFTVPQGVNIGLPGIIFWLTLAFRRG